MGLNWRAGAQTGLLTLGEGIMTKYERDLKNLENEAQFARQKTLEELRATNAKDLARTQSSLQEESAKSLAKWNAEQEIAQAGPRAEAEAEATHAKTIRSHELAAADIYKSLPEEQKAERTLKEYTQEYLNLQATATKGLPADIGGEIFRQAVTSWEDMRTTDPDGYDARIAETLKAAESAGKQITPIQAETLAKQQFISETIGMAREGILQKPARPGRKVTPPSPAEVKQARREVYFNEGKTALIDGLKASGMSDKDIKIVIDEIESSAAVKPSHIDTGLLKARQTPAAPTFEAALKGEEINKLSRTGLLNR
jgi:hypothetical protein